MTPLSGQVSLVSGAGSGIGRAIALALAAQGAITCLVGRTLEKLDDTRAAMPPAAPPASLYPCDLTVDEQVDRLQYDLQRRFGRLDVLVLCAGAIAVGALEQASLEAFDALYRANVRGPLRLIQILLPMLKTGPGQIVFINSSVGLAAPARAGQYASTKHALKALADSLRAEVNPLGIRVLSIYPGRTATPLQAALYAKRSEEYRPELLLQPEDVASVVVNALALPRTAEVTDISIRPLRKSY
jgi:NAD(P)-dependent dehydrogenase (short-subunit alcohol dehydrogenase family)